MKQSYEEKNGATPNKRGAYHWIILNIPMRGHVPIKMDGTEYYSDDEYDDPYGEWMKEDRRKGSVRVASQKDIENFILSCRLSDEDLPKYHYAVQEDVRRRTGYGYSSLIHQPRKEVIKENAVEEFYRSAKLHSQPVRNKQLCDFLRQGIMVMAMEVTTYFLIVHIGNDLTSLFKENIEKCRNTGRCTFTVTDRAFAAQRASRCRTCFGDDVTMAICDNCIATCHRGHDTYVSVKGGKERKGKNKTGKKNPENRRNKQTLQWTIPKTLMYCDCGHKLSCKLLGGCASEENSE